MSLPRRSRCFALALVLGILPAGSRSASAQETTRARAPIIMVLSGGFSLAAHQAGMTYATLAALRSTALPAGADFPPELEIEDLSSGTELRGISGASVGALNGLFAALSWCLAADAPFLPEDNLFWDAWSTLDWDALFPFELSCNEYTEKFPFLRPECSGGAAFAPADGVLSFNAFSGVRIRVRELLAHLEAFRPNCRVPIRIALSAERGMSMHIGEHELPTVRRQVAFELRTFQHIRRRPGEPTGVVAKFCATDPGDLQSGAPMLHLPERTHFDALRSGALLRRVVHANARMQALLELPKGAGETARTEAARELSRVERLAWLLQRTAEETAAGAPVDAEIRSCANDLRDRAHGQGACAHARALALQGSGAREAADLKDLKDACKPAASGPKSSACADIGTLTATSPADLRALEREVAQIRAEAGAECRELDVDSVLDTVLAGSAFPVLTRPQPIQFCGLECDPGGFSAQLCPAETQPCEERFLEGAIFDRTPLAGASAIITETPDRVSALLLEPAPAFRISGDERRRAERERSEKGYMPNGIAFFRSLASDFADVAEGYENQTLLRNGKLPERMVRLSAEERTVGSLLFHLGAFAHPELAKLDYARGFAVGAHWAFDQEQIAKPELLERLKGTPRIAAAVDLSAKARKAPGEKIPCEVLDRLGLAGYRPLFHEACVVRNALLLIDRDPNLNTAPIEAFGRFVSAVRAESPAPEWSKSRRFREFLPWWHSNVARTMQRIEDIDQESGGRARLSARALLVGEWREHAVAIDHGSGWEWGRSTVPPDGVSEYAVRTLFPSVVRGNLSGGMHFDWDWLSYASARDGRGLQERLFIGPALQFHRRGLDPDLWLAGGALGLIIDHLAFWSLHVGARLNGLARVSASRDGNDPRFHVGGELFVRFLGSEVELAAGVTDLLPLSPRDELGVPYVAVGLTDVNGLIYWVTRLAYGH